MASPSDEPQTNPSITASLVARIAIYQYPDGRYLIEDLTHPESPLSVKPLDSKRMQEVVLSLVQRGSSYLSS